MKNARNCRATSGAVQVGTWPDLLFIAFHDTVNPHATQAYGSEDTQQKNCNWY
jgi:hypothetical protein